jgi:sodium-dependent phosphate cotransporter
MPQAIDWLATTIVAQAGPLLSVLVAMGLLLGSLRLLGRAFEEVDFEQIRERYRWYFASRWIAFGVGLGLTALTTSIAFSLGIIVPIYNCGVLRYREVIPYILGANIGTLLDTVVVSLFVEVAGGMAAVMLVVGLTALVTLPALVALELYRGLIEGVLDRLLGSRGAFLLFLGSLVLGPLALVGVGWGLAG